MTALMFGHKLHTPVDLTQNCQGLHGWSTCRRHTNLPSDTKPMQGGTRSMHMTHTARAALSAPGERA